MHQRRFVPSALLASCLILGLAATSQPSADGVPRMGSRSGGQRAFADRSPEAIDPAASGPLTDLSLGATPPSSRQVAVDRLLLLGVDEAMAQSLLDEADAARSFGIGPAELDLASVLGPLGLGEWAGSKAQELLRAYLLGEAVALVGSEATPDEAAILARLRDEGMDADAAAWMILKTRGLDAWGDPAAFLKIGELATLEPGLRPAAEAGAMDLLSLRRDGIRLVENPAGIEPVAPSAFCRTCPSIDAILTASTIYRTVRGTLGQGDCKMYRLTVAAGRQYRFSFCEGGGTASFDTVLDAYGTQCQGLGSNDDFCATRSQLDLTTAGIGYIYIRVSGKNAAGGTFTLAYKDAGPSTTGTTCSNCPTFNFGTYTPTANWTTHSSTLSSGGCRMYRFQVSLNRSYEFSTCQGGGTANFDTRIETFTGSCVAGPSNDDACMGGQSHVSLTANATQYIYVRVSGNGGSGNYTLAYRDTTGLCQDCPNWNFGTLAPSTNWTTHSSTFSSGSCKMYRFFVQANDSYIFTFCQGGGTATFDTVLEAFSYDGTSCSSIASNDDSCGLSSELVVAPGYTGYLYVRVSGLAGGSGPYTLAYSQFCQSTCAPPDFGPLAMPAFGYATHSSIMPTGGGCRVYAFNLVQDQPYVFTFCPSGPDALPTSASATFDTMLGLYDSNCLALASNDDTCGLASQILHAATYTGVHYIVVTPVSTGGSFTLAYGPDCTIDTDGDRLPDCQEDGSNVYVSALDPGTSLNNPDTDGDSIEDGDEVLGTIGGLDLPGMGAHPLRQDIFMEYDWFDDNATDACGCGSPCGAHSHRPSAAMINLVQAAFAAAPTINADGTTGIAIHQDYGQGGAFTGGNLVADADGVILGFVGNPSDGEFDGHKASNFAASRNGYFHYTLFAHQYGSPLGCSSGQAELPGDDMMVTLYCCASTTNVAFTIMHELGHNLGLRHGGNTDCNRKPNYNSIMNYRYQFNGIDTTCDAAGDAVLDYSRNVSILLDETNLSEPAGICGASPINWNGDGDSTDTGLAFDINMYPVAEGGAAAVGVDCGGLQTSLGDFDDWANLIFNGITIGDPDADGQSQFLPNRVRQEIISCEFGPNSPIE